MMLYINFHGQATVFTIEFDGTVQKKDGYSFAFLLSEIEEYIRLKIVYDEERVRLGLLDDPHYHNDGIDERRFRIQNDEIERNI